MDLLRFFVPAGAPVTSAGVGISSFSFLRSANLPLSMRLGYVASAGASVSIDVLGYSWHRSPYPLGCFYFAPSGFLFVSSFGSYPWWFYVFGRFSGATPKPLVIRAGWSVFCGLILHRSFASLLRTAPCRCRLSTAFMRFSSCLGP